MVQEINNIVNGKRYYVHMPSERYVVAKVEEYTIDVFCASCDSNDSGMWHLGQLVNAWEKVTGSRYMQVDASRKLKTDAITLGDSIAANKGTALEAWYGNAFYILRWTLRNS